MKATKFIAIIFVILGIFSPILITTHGQSSNNPIYVNQSLNDHRLTLYIQIYQENQNDPYPLISFDFFFENNSFYFSKLVEMKSLTTNTEINLPTSFNETLNLHIVSKINGITNTNELIIGNLVTTISTNISSTISTQTFNPFPYDPFLSVILFILLILLFIGIFGGVYFAYSTYSQNLNRERNLSREEITESEKDPFIVQDLRSDFVVDEDLTWKKLGFRSLEEYQEARKYGVENQWELNLIKSYATDNYREALKLFLHSLEKEMVNLFMIKREWSLNEISQELSIPMSHLPSILEESFSKYHFDADLDLSSKIIRSYYPLKFENESILSYVNKVRDNVAIQINQIAEITQLDKILCIRIIKDLISSGEIKGEYLELEGVFIKHEITIGEQFVGEFTCQICKSIKHVSQDDLVLCPYCKNPFHKGHFLEWLKTKGKCPICQEKVDQSRLN